MPTDPLQDVYQVGVGVDAMIETTFFQLLSRFSEVAQDVRLGEHAKGRAVIQAHYNNFREMTKTKLSDERISRLMKMQKA